MKNLICILSIAILWLTASSLFAAEAKLTVEGETHLATTGGNVGIGTTSPSGRLHVAGGDLLIQSTANPKLGFAHSAGMINASIYRESSSGKLFIKNDQGKPLILDNGNVGIGTTSPQEKLHVNGKVKAKEFITGDITFTNKQTGQVLWNMYEDEKGLYLKSATTGKIYEFVLREVKNNANTTSR